MTVLEEGQQPQHTAEVENEYTFAIIKPDAVQQGYANDILNIVELQGFTIVCQKQQVLTETDVDEFYSEHKYKPFFSTLKSFMTSGPIYALVFSKRNAILEWRQLMGPTNSLKAKDDNPQCLRALFGTNGTMNAVHGYDSQSSARREIKFFFPDLIMEPLLDQEISKLYIQNNLTPTLSKALAELAQKKPSSTGKDAITFIGKWLINNNPNRPILCLPGEELPIGGLADVDSNIDNETQGPTQVNEQLKQTNSSAEVVEASI